MLSLFKAVQTVTPSAIPYCKLVIGHWMLPDVCTSDHAVLLALDQHQILTQHLPTTRRDTIKIVSKGGITRFVFSNKPREIRHRAGRSNGQHVVVTRHLSIKPGTHKAICICKSDSPTQTTAASKKTQAQLTKSSYLSSNVLPELLNAWNPADPLHEVH